jgi:hypothetical protein
MGLCFQNDLFYLLKQDSFWEYLIQPVSNFLKLLNQFPQDDLTHN